MGRRGPPKQPTRLRVLRGNPSKEPVPADEPQPSADQVAPPPFCQGEAADLFTGYAKQLRDLGLVTNLDVDALGQYCVSMVMFRQHLEVCQRGGAVNVVRDENGKVRFTQVSASFTIVNKLMGQMLRIGQQFGMTPSSRTALATNDGKANDPLAAWLQKHA